MKIMLVTNTQPELPVSEYGKHLVDSIRKTDVELTVVGNDCWGFNSYSILFRIVKAVRGVKPDLVWFNITLGSFGHTFANLLGLLTPLVLKLLGWKVIITLHNIVDGMDNVKGGSITVLGAKAATFLLVHSGTICVLLPEYQKILKGKYKANNVHCLPHGTLGKVQCLPPPRVNNITTVLAFGIFGTHKPLEPVLEAMKMLRDCPVRLVVAGGSNAHAPRYMQEIHQRYAHLRNVQFQGYIPEEQVAETFALADIVILTNITNSGKSGALIQSGMYGKPVIAGDLPMFHNEQETGYNIEFCDPADPVSIAETILNLSQEDNGLLERRGGQNFCAATSVSMDEVVSMYFRIIRERNGIKWVTDAQSASQSS